MKIYSPKSVCVFLEIDEHLIGYPIHELSDFLAGCMRYASWAAYISQMGEPLEYWPMLCICMTRETLKKKIIFETECDL